jgi:hypothetical protein
MEVGGGDEAASKQESSKQGGSSNIRLSAERRRSAGVCVAILFIFTPAIV